MEHKNSAIAMFVEHAQVDKAVRRLREAGIDLHGVSVAGRGYQCPGRAAAAEWRTGDGEV